MIKNGNTQGVKARLYLLLYSCSSLEFVCDTNSCQDELKALKNYKWEYFDVLSQSVNYSFQKGLQKMSHTFEEMCGYMHINKNYTIFQQVELYI